MESDPEVDDEEAGELHDLSMAAYRSLTPAERAALLDRPGLTGEERNSARITVTEVAGALPVVRAEVGALERTPSIHRDSLSASPSAKAAARR